jgi:formylglycine-generating enzyme required for sulfatase activity
VRAIRLALRPDTRRAPRAWVIALIALGACTARGRHASPATERETPSSPAGAEIPADSTTAPAPVVTEATVSSSSDASELAPFAQKISGTTLDIEMVPVPAGWIDIAGTNATDDPRKVEFGAFYLSKREISWEVYDAFVFGLDEPSAGTPDATDAVSRPSHPYITMDRGYGHAGYPAISVSFRGAQQFCRWLTIKTGRRYRLPSEAEWEFACRAGVRTKYPFGDDPRGLDSVAWYRANAEGKTHPCGQKQPNALGFLDMLGNAGEWCTSSADQGVVRGGTFRDDAGAVTCSARKLDDPAWNKSDPQLPRGVWWLADGGFVGFRVLCEGAGEMGRR